MNRNNILLINEKILNKRNRNFDCYYISENISPDDNNFSETHDNKISLNTSTDDTKQICPVISQTPSKAREREISASIHPIPGFTIEFASPVGSK